MDGLLLSLVVGPLALHVLGADTRQFPVKSARYEVRFGRLRREEVHGAGAWLLGLEIRPPKWRRAVMQPPEEYLMIQLIVEGREWLQSKWMFGRQGSVENAGRRGYVGLWHRF